MAKTEVLRDLGDRELLERLASAKEELFNLRFQHVTGQLDNTARLGAVRKQVARLNTEMLTWAAPAATASRPEAQKRLIWMPGTWKP